MKNIALVASLSVLLAGCMSSYEPKMSAAAEDLEKYSSDLVICKNEAKERQINAAYNPKGLAKSATAGALGLVGAGIVSATSDKDDDYHKSPLTMVDECMTAKGHPVVKVSR